MTRFYLQIDDGELWCVTGVAKLVDGLPTGGFYGSDCDYSGHVKTHKANQRGIAFVNAEGHKLNGERFGLEGIFKRGHWEAAPDGLPLYQVWERIT